MWLYVIHILFLVFILCVVVLVDGVLFACLFLFIFMNKFAIYLKYMIISCVSILILFACTGNHFQFVFTFISYICIRYSEVD